MTGIAVYHQMRKDDDFETTAQQLWEIVKLACRDYPQRLVYFYLDIEGHRVAEGGFDHDSFEIQLFVINKLMPYLFEAHLPLFTMSGEVIKNFDGRSDIPDKLQIRKAPTRRSGT